MDSLSQVREWINQNAPALAKVYENKYVGMIYDRFASLPPKKQRQVLVGGVAGVGAFVFLILLSFYLSYWGSAGKAQKAESMVNMLMLYQKARRAQEGQIHALERNNLLGTPDALKKHLLDQGRSANISPRMIKAEEKAESGDPQEESKAGQDVRMKQATVKLERVNLTQLRDFLQGVEFGPYNLSVSSLQISNDDKIRGYMNVELGVVAYLFQLGEETSP